MARNFKMFDHVVAPERRNKGLSFIRSRPLESFLAFQFVYMLFSFFSYRSLLHSYLSLIICCFVIYYSDYFMNIIFEKAFGVISEMVRQHSEKMVMAPYMMHCDIDDSYVREDVGEDAAEDVAEDAAEDAAEDVAEDAAEDVDEDVVEGAEQDEDDTDNAVDVQQDMDNMVDETSGGWTVKDPTAYLELRQRHVPRG